MIRRGILVYIWFFVILSIVHCVIIPFLLSILPKFLYIGHSTVLVDSYLEQAFNEKRPSDTVSLLVTFNSDLYSRSGDTITLLYDYYKSKMIPFTERIKIGTRYLRDWITEIHNDPLESAIRNILHNQTKITLDHFKRSISLIHLVQGYRTYNILRDSLKKSIALLIEKLHSIKQKFILSKSFVSSQSILLQVSDRSVVEALIKSRQVSEIHVNRPFSAISSKEETSFNALNPSPEWNIAYIGADQLWNITTGTGMIYASADTGVDWHHPTLESNYAGVLYSNINITDPNSLSMIKHDYSWWDGIRRPLFPNSNTIGIGRCGIQSKQPCDDIGHGTHTTCTAVGSFGFGVAPGANWIACRNMDNGIGTIASYLECLDFFLAPTDLNGKFPDPSRRPHVIGNSYGCPSKEGCAPLAFHKAVKAIREAGIFMSVSAGNDGPKCDSLSFPPSYEPLVFTVGATKFKSDNITDFSSRGVSKYIKDRLDIIDPEKYVKPDIVAPGEKILSAYPNYGFRYFSGTSMASPLVSGSVLLVYSACPYLVRKVDKTQDLLLRTARPILLSQFNTSPCNPSESMNAYPNSVYGYGILQINSSLREILNNSMIQKNVYL